MVLKSALLIFPLHNKSEAYNVSDSYTHLNPANQASVCQTVNCFFSTFFNEYLSYSLFSRLNH